MERIRITIHPRSSDAALLRVADAMQQVLDYLKLFEEAERAVVDPNESFVWRLESASTNSPFTVVAVADSTIPNVNVDQQARKVKREFVSGMHRLIRNKEKPSWKRGSGP